MVGRTVSRYQIVDKLGEGGMGVVYKARDLHLDRTVALKILPPDKVADADRERRFNREAKAASAHNHSNIVTIYDIDEADGIHFIAMECVTGQSLANRVGAQGLPVHEALDYALGLASALAAAHAAGIIHRDLKPANIMISQEGAVKVLDFGLAKLVEPHPDPEAPTRTLDTLTSTGTVVGTVAYMSPEQAAGGAVDARTDVFSFGAVLYEMLTGAAAFRRDSAASTLAAVLRDSPPPVESVRRDIPSGLGRILDRCLEKDREARYPSGTALHEDLVACRERLMEGHAGWRGLARQPRFILAAAVLLLALLAAGTWLGLRSARARWARNTALPETERLIAAGQLEGAFRLVRQAERYIPDDAELQRLKGQCSAPASVETVPPGADVFWKSYRSPNEAWEPLGKSPVKGAPVPRRYLRWRIVMQGFDPIEAAGFGSVPLTATLARAGEAPGMVRIPAGPFVFRPMQNVSVGEFWLDAREVTNREYKVFVDQGGYEKRQYWKQPFVEDGKTLSWEEAMSRFRDTTGRPGPAAWEMGAFPEGQEDYPVGGVSWHEAAAYAEFAGKQLPTIYHWRKAAVGANYEIIEFSNFGGRGPVKAGSLAGLSPYGHYDMAGNLKEWCWNESGGRRYLLGGAWNEPPYMFADFDARSPFARLATFGFRCAKYAGPLDPALLAGMTLMSRDYTREKPVPEEVYRAYKSQYAYDRTALNPVVEARDDGSAYWRREKITLNAAYGGERMPVHLFLPRNARPPYQAVIFFPGSNAFLERSSSDRVSPAEGRTRTDFLVRSGRAVVYPILYAMYERKPQAMVERPAEASAAWRDMMVACYKDLARTLDYLETRRDIDGARLGYYGASVGAMWAPIFTALDPRYKAAVYLVGGLPFERYAPEVDPLNFATRSHVPTLMLNGRYDFSLTVDGCQRPLFRLLGAPEKDKRHVLFDTAHDLPGAAVVKETLAWLDRYLGPVRTTP